MIPLAVVLQPGLASAVASPGPVAGDDFRLAWEETAPSLNLPTFADYLRERRDDLVRELPALFVSGKEKEVPREDVLPVASRVAGGRSFAEITALGGTAGRTDVGAIWGIAVKPFDAAAAYDYGQSRSGDGAFTNNRTRLLAETAFADRAGTTVGFAGNYEALHNGPNDNVTAANASFPNLKAESGEMTTFLQATVWSEAKFATRLTGVFNDGRYEDTRISDNTLSAEGRYDFFWLEENLAHGTLTLAQENYKYDDLQQGHFFGRLSLENEFPIADRVYLSAGVAAFSYRRERPTYRLYPRGKFLWRLSRGWGCFVDYRPEFMLPGFRELYMQRNYTVPTAARPVQDLYAATRAGLTYNFRGAARLTATGYENRFRYTCVLADVGVGRCSYYDPGKSYIRGCELNLLVETSRIRQRVDFNVARGILLVNPNHHYPYLPSYGAKGTINLKLPHHHELTAEIQLVGPRYYTAVATEPLAPAWVPSGAASVKLGYGVSLNLGVENFTDARYVDAGGVLAPRRSLQAGLEVTF